MLGETLEQLTLEAARVEVKQDNDVSMEMDEKSDEESD